MADPALYLKGGVIPERDNEHYIIRLRIPAGLLGVEALGGIAIIAKKYGIITTHLTTRQTIELLHVGPEMLDKLLADLEKNGTPIGAERNEVVNVTSCLGTNNCKYAVIDSVSLAKKLDKKHFGKEMPVKVRIAISACPNGCTSERLNEIGVTGLRRPVRNEGLCTGCGTCRHYCREHAIIIENGKLRLNQEDCMLCGFCIHACHFQYINFEDALYLITLGGRRGRHPKIGRTFYIAKSENDVVEIAEKIIYWISRSIASDQMLPEQLTNEEFTEFREKVMKSLKPLGIEGMDPTNAYCLQN
ncbi:MAG: nitrite reductase [Methanocalculaceae archaeon]|jgi:dissimilatory sulfite reductase (desulfoviridin) alpha/beta subunit|nr:nitrite reductase [Methanocalculaceae archaeon]